MLALGSGLFFLFGSQLIYYGMKFNVRARLNGPVWSLVSSLHSLIVYSFLAIGVCAFARFVILPLVFLFIPEKKPVEAKPKAVMPRPPVVPSPEQIEEKQKLEEQEKQEVIQRRRERSAEAVACDALDDLL